MQRAAGGGEPGDRRQAEQCPGPESHSPGPGVALWPQCGPHSHVASVLRASWPLTGWFLRDSSFLFLFFKPNLFPLAFKRISLRAQCAPRKSAPGGAWQGGAWSPVPALVCFPGLRSVGLPALSDTGGQSSLLTLPRKSFCPLPPQGQGFKAASPASTEPPLMRRGVVCGWGRVPPLELRHPLFSSLLEMDSTEGQF